jgi:translation initiation factor IF-1
MKRVSSLYFFPGSSALSLGASPWLDSSVRPRRSAVPKKRDEEAMMSRDVVIRVEATVREVLPNAVFKVELESGRAVLAHVSESLRLNLVRLVPGNRVTLELAARDGGRGRIVLRR